MRRKIFCNDCGDYFKLYVKRKNIISNTFFVKIFKQAFVFGIFSIMVYGVYLLDGKMKKDYKKKTRDEHKIDNEYELLILMLVLTLIMIFCLYHRISGSFADRNRV